MAKGNSSCSTPKRGAFPAPRNVLADATPYKPEEPDKSGVADDQPSSGANPKEESREQPDRGSGKKG